MSRFTIPHSWKWVKLESIAQISSGGTPRRNQPEYFNGEIPWATPTDITSLSSLYLDKTKEKITEKGLKNSSTKLLPIGSILLTSHATIGKTAIINNPTATNQNIYGLICDEALVSNEFLSRYLNWSKEQLLRISFGTTFKALSPKHFKKFQIPLPTILEQEKIIGILKQVEVLKELRVNIEAKGKKIIQSIFNEMFAISKEDWEKYKLKDIIDLEAGKNVEAQSYPAKTDKWGVLKISAVTTGKFLTNENKEILSKVTPNPKNEISNGDLLITRLNTSSLIGASAIVDDLNQKLLLPDNIWRVLLKRKLYVNKTFLFGFLNSPKVRHEISKRAMGTSSSMNYITQSNFLSIEIILPSKKEQVKFEKIVQKIWNKIDIKQQQVSKAIEDLSLNLNNQAFTGQLTQGFRKKEQSDISSQTILRDATLKMKSTSESSSEIKEIIQLPKNINSYLSNVQQELFEIVEIADGYVLAENDFNEQNIPPNQIQRNLDLLAEIGLIKSVNMAIAPGKIGDIFYTPAHRSLTKVDNKKETDLESLEKETNI